MINFTYVFIVIVINANGIFFIFIEWDVSYKALR